MDPAVQQQVLNTLSPGLRREVPWLALLVLHKGVLVASLPLLIQQRCHAACTLQVVVHKFREVIAATPYLRNRSIELQAAVAPLLRPVFMEQGESVFAEGMAPDAMYVTLSGGGGAGGGRGRRHRQILT